MRYPEGQFSWTDLMTPEPEQARTFYSGLFGWDAKDMQTPTGPPYTMFLLHGQVVAGLGSQPPRLREAGIPPAWTSYINVENLERTIGRGIKSGGTVIVEPMGVSPEGRMAMIADPSGAVVGLWQPEEHQGVDLRDAPGDTGYLVATLESKEGSEKSVAGAMSMPPAVPPQVSSSCSVYFEVADCDASTWLATELGGQTLVPPMEVGDMRFSGITDPSGAMFMLLSGTQSSR